MTPALDVDDGAPLSDAEIAGIENIVESAMPADATAIRGPGLSALLSRGIDAVTKVGGRADPDASEMWTCILEALSDMSIRTPVDQQLQSLLHERGFTVNKALLPNPANLRKVRHYTAASRGDYKLALIHLPHWFLQVPDTFGNFSVAIQPVKDHHGRIISPGLDAPSGGYVSGLQSLSAREQSWSFVPWALLKEVLDGTTNLETALNIPVLAVPPKQGAEEAYDPKLDEADTAFVVKLLVDNSMDSGLEAKKYFSNLVTQLGLPPGFLGELNNRFDNNASTSATALLTYLSSKGQYGAASQHKGDYFVGRLLMNRLDFVGAEDEKKVALIISRRKLVTHAEDLQTIKTILGDGR